MKATYVVLTLDEAKKLRCADCEYHVYKGDDEQYCRIAGWRDFSLKPHQKKPGFCPIMKRARKENENQG